MKSRRILSFLLLGILSLACEEEQQTWLSEMEGKISCGVPEVVGINQPVTFTAVGISTPGNVAYTWKTPDFSPTTFTGTSFEAVAPAIAGEYFISITAKSAGYRDVTYQQKVIVVPCAPMQGNLSIAIPAEVVKGEDVSFTAIGITVPEENVTYHWTASNFNPSTYTGSAVFEPRVPAAAGTYEIIVIATAANFCETSVKDTIQVIPGRKMQGLLDIEVVTAEIIKGQKVMFVASGISTPRVELLSYKWEAFNSTAGTVSGTSGNSYTATCPGTAGVYNVAVTAKADGYCDTTIREEIVVSDEKDMGGYISISISPPEVVYSQPATFTVSNHTAIPTDSISFEWNASGFLPDHHQSTGHTFTAIAPDIPGNYDITVTARVAKYKGTIGTATVNVKGGLDMKGTLNINAPGEIVKDLPAVFSVSGALDTRPDAPITYKWDAPDFDPDSFIGDTFTGVPKAAETRTIKLTATANGYTPRIVTKDVDVIGGLDMGDLTISASKNSPFLAGPDNVTFTPNLVPADPPLRSGVTYTWSATSCTPNSFPGDSYNPTALPSEPGTYKVTLTARATGYNEKTATYPYTVTCRPMDVSFNLSRAELLTNDETTLTVNPPVAPTSGVSYTWTVPTGFDITAGSSITPSVTIKAPATNLLDQAPITLTAQAVNYCPATHIRNITVVSCYPATITPPVISISNPNVTEDDNGIFHVRNFQDVTFRATAVTSLPPEKPVSYAWTIEKQGGKAFTPSTSSAATNNTSFTTKAPVHDNGTIYTVSLQVTADGYCPFPSVDKGVVVDMSAGSLSGTVKILEAEVPASGSDKQPVLWLVKDRPVTLTAAYNYSSGEIPLVGEIALAYEWFWDGISENPISLGTGKKLSFTPGTETDSGHIIVVVSDTNGRTPTYVRYPLTVKYCAAYNLPGLHANVNYPCGSTNGYSSAYVKDTTWNGGTYIYPIRLLGSNWWFTENLRANKQNNAYTGRIDNYGAYYPFSALGALSSSLSGSYCPKGWRIPSKDEWDALNNSVAPLSTDQFKGLVTSNASTEWDSGHVTNLPNSGDNKRDFNLIPAGYYNGTKLLSTGTVAMFFIKDGSLIQQYGHTDSGEQEGIASQPGINENRWYTVRCVNDK
jgi:uncharacterized protein (TIGR02145 family)